MCALYLSGGNMKCMGVFSLSMDVGYDVYKSPMMWCRYTK